MTQTLIAAVAALGGDVTAARVVMSLVAAGAVAAGVVVAGRIGGRVAAWAFLVPSCYGPFLVWGAALYQEGTFLLVLFSGLALALSGRVRLADVVIGLLGLVRYEGWPCVVLYLAWRRDPRALVSLWGMGVWLLIHFGLDWTGYRASPVDFDDWEGLGERTTLASWSRDALRLFRGAWYSGGISFGVAAAIGVVARWRRPGVLLLAAIGLAQVAAVTGWLAGLEIATYRMLLVPVVVAGVLGAVGAAAVWARLPRSLRPVLVPLGIVLLCVGVIDGWRASESEVERLAPELALLAQMKARPDCHWIVWPRVGLGTRQRHDGCEVLQGLGEARHGDGFWCGPWAFAPPSGHACVAYADWVDDGYRLSFADVSR